MPTLKTPCSTLAEGHTYLKGLIESLNSNAAEDRNEAMTRLEIIDEILHSLGWNKGDYVVEGASDGGFADYELGKPRAAIWEAKREGVSFQIPAGSDTGLFTDIKSLCKYDKRLEAAVNQVSLYSSKRGTGLAVVTNGHQIIAFVASRLDGIAPIDGRCLLITSLQQLCDEFNTVWQFLSKAAVDRKHYLNLLRSNNINKVPSKLSSYLHQYPKYRYPSDLQTTLRAIAELLIDDIPQTHEEEFIRHCYCQSGAIAQDALISKQILNARYAALFKSTDLQPSVVDANPKDATGSEISADLLAEALHKRPVVLLGDVGVGKSSFLKNLVYVEAPEVFRNAIYLYLDLGTQAALNTAIHSYVLSEIESQLLNNFKLDINEYKFVKGVYASEIDRFKRSPYAELYGLDSDKYNEQLMHMLDERLAEKSEHIRRSVEHICKARHKQIIIALDNCDQRDDNVQQAAFVISQELASRWSASVFISLRPHTFYRSRRSGALSAYPQRVFAISPPRVDEVIEKRLSYAAAIADGRILAQELHGFSMYIPSVAKYLGVLIHSFRRSSELREFLTNITAGNIREAINFVKSFIGSPNVDAEKIVNAQESYVIPVHEFSKNALLGEFSHYDPRSSIALNLFDIRYPTESGHFVAPLILAYLKFDGPHLTKEGLVSTGDVIKELSPNFANEVIEDALRRLTNKKLIETSERVTFEEDEVGLYGALPELFRITTLGAYHLERWLADFAYIDAMVFDTPIFDDQLREFLVADVNSLDIRNRLDRSLKFRGYLERAWRNSAISVSYFDFSEAIKNGNESFSRVSRAVEKIRSQSNAPGY